jgi:hypothetical protein
LLVAGAARDNERHGLTIAGSPVNQPTPTDTASVPVAERESFLHRHPRLRRELYILGAALVTGLIVMPIAIYVVGTLSLGPYTSGGWTALFADFFRGIFRLWWPAWVVFLGPYALVLFLRGTRLFYRRFLRDTEPA